VVGCAYQCVEFAQRYFHKKHGTAKIWGCNANGMCGDGCRAKGVKKTKNPQPGDLYVMDGKYGHVAVINKIDGSNVHVYEQNWDSSGRNVHPYNQAICFLTAGHTPTPPPPPPAPTPAPPPPAPPGSCPRLGFYCGNDGLGLDSNTLYDCKEAVTPLETSRPFLSLLITPSSPLRTTPFLPLLIIPSLLLLT
jgi:hypothetical protein